MARGLVGIKSLALICACLLGGSVRAQDVPSTPAQPNQVKPNWSFSSSVSTYVVPDSRNYVQPTITADRERLHLEARYNYEDLETGSLWIGYNFSAGKKISFEITPILGGVIGNTTGIAPGYRAALSWWRFDVYSESEYVITTKDPTDSYYYNWSQATFSPAESLNAGLIVQRTRAYDSPREVQPGFLVGLSYKRMEFAAHMFNPDSNPTYVILAAINF